MTFHITAFNDCGESPPSNQVSVTGQCPPGKPGLVLNRSDYTQYNDSVSHTFWIYAPATKQDEVIEYRAYAATGSGIHTTVFPPDSTFLYDMQCSEPENDIYVTAVNFGGESQTSELITLAGQACPDWQPSGHGIW